jgi:hypothetical protein
MWAKHGDLLATRAPHTSALDSAQMKNTLSCHKFSKSRSDCDDKTSIRLVLLVNFSFIVVGKVFIDQFRETF